jgi:tetratricopeptide (TPR) repeat protein
MKTFLAVLLSFSLMSSFAQDERYHDAMLNTLEKFGRAATIQDLTDVANTFERIAQSESGEWLPLYHAAHAWLTMGFVEQDVKKKDAYFDKAQQLLDIAMKIAPDESELYTLQAFIYPGKITVDPMGRGPVLVGKMNEALDKAIRLNPDNPRSYYLRAVTLVNMPEAFGGGKAVARPIFETAREKFNQFKPVSSLWPNWGQDMNDEEIAKL